MTLKKLGGGGLSPQQAVEEAINNTLPSIDELSSRSDIGVSQTEVQNAMANIASRQESMRALAAEANPFSRAAASQTAMQEIRASQTAMQEIRASQTAMQEIAASQTAMAEIDKNDFAVRSIMCGTTTQDPTTFADADAISQDATAMAEIAGNQTTMNTIAASQTAMQEIAASQTAIQEITASQTAMQQVAASQTAMQEIADSQTAMKPVVDSDTAVSEVLASNNAIDIITSSLTAMSAIQSTSNVNNRNTFFADVNFQSSIVASRPAERKVTWEGTDSSDFSGFGYALTGNGIGGSTALRYKNTNADGFPDPSLLQDTSLGDGIPYVQEVKGGSALRNRRGRIIFNCSFESLDGDVQIEFGSDTSALQSRDGGTDLDTITAAGTFNGYIVYPHADGSVDVIVTEDGSLKGRMSTTKSIAEPPKTDYTYAYNMNTRREEVVVFDAR